MDRKYNILYVLASPGWGGGEQYVYDLVSALGDEGHKCSVVTPAGNTNREKLRRLLPAERIFELPMKSMFDRGSARRLARIAEENGIDIVHVNKFADAFIAARARKLLRKDLKIVMTRHLVRKGKAGYLYNRLYSGLDALVFVSEIAKNAFLSAGPEIAPGKIRVIHTGIPDVPQSGASVRQVPPVIAFSGRVVPEKGLDVLLEALGRLTCFDFSMKIIGGGEPEYIAELKKKAEVSGVSGRVVFTGFTDNVNGALQDASIGVLPSVVPEGFGLAAVEYMRAGMAVVTTNNGAQREFLTDGETALLVPPGDAAKLTEAIGKLLQDPAGCGEMGRKARGAYVANLTYDKFLGKMKALYASLGAHGNSGE